VAGQAIAGVVAGQTSVDAALKAANAAADRVVKQSGYQK
jgi:sorbitol/mannitol transport system substrate-binding protein